MPSQSNISNKSETRTMKLMSIILQDRNSDPVIEALVRSGYAVTHMASTGGFLRQGNVTLMVGVEAKKVESILGLLKRHCHTTEPGRHAATVFVLDMPEYLKI